MVSPDPAALLSRIEAALGDGVLLKDPSDLAEYGRDWTKVIAPAPLAIALPRTTEEVATIVRLAREHGVAIVPSGGRTGLAAGAVALLLLGFVFADRRFRANPAQWLAGLALGALVVGGWYVSGHLGFGENPETLETGYFGTNTRTLESLSFVAPLAYGLELLMLWTDKSLHLSFGIASALGVALGSAAWALATRSFRWEGFASVADLRAQLVGAVLMGFGGVTAMGCTVGQGLTGVSTLALGSFLALASILAGSAATLKYITWRAEREA